MLGGNARAAVGRIWAPVVARLARAGVTPDAVTLVGTLGAIAGAVGLIATGQLFWGAVTVTAFVLLDMLDGALARARGGGSVFGAVLDSTGDRAADAAIFGALV
ncbi:MAG TPA: CDP-alcohol phosphatidyltransferase family protein, partial [Pilimelia sp.]|nr:CDP-alcohol phosphatidyltransferase family protein [Pilimelia sp.]